MMTGMAETAPNTLIPTPLGLASNVASTPIRLLLITIGVIDDGAVPNSLIEIPTSLLPEIVLPETRVPGLVRSWMPTRFGSGAFPALNPMVLSRICVPTAPHKLPQSIRMPLSLLPESRLPDTTLLVGRAVDVPSKPTPLPLLYATVPVGSVPILLFTTRLLLEAPKK